MKRVVLLLLIASVVLGTSGCGITTSPDTARWQPTVACISRAHSGLLKGPTAEGWLYLVITVAPKSVDRQVCRAVAKGLTPVPIGTPRGKLGTGKPYCAYRYALPLAGTNRKGSVLIEVYSDRAGAGTAYCARWHPSGFHRVR